MDNDEIGVWRRCIAKWRWDETRAYTLRGSLDLFGPLVNNTIVVFQTPCSTVYCIAEIFLVKELNY